MLMVISPAKSLDFESTLATTKFSQSVFLMQSQQLISEIRALSPVDLEQLMGISPQLASLNFHRFQDWKLPFETTNSRPAVLAFTGDVYQGLQATSLTEAQFDFAQGHLRILSGLYGLLRPLDLIQPYRLEMGTRFENTQGKNLYAFWGSQINQQLTKDLHQSGSNVLINLASNEYFKAVNAKQLLADVITPVFKDYKKGQYKVVSFYAKKARGLMTAYIIKNAINAPEAIKNFNVNGYYFSPEFSNETEWVFLRDEMLSG